MLMAAITKLTLVVVPSIAKYCFCIYCAFSWRDTAQIASITSLRLMLFLFASFTLSLALVLARTVDIPLSRRSNALQRRRGDSIVQIGLGDYSDM